MAEAPPLRPPCQNCGYLADPAAGPVNFCPKCGQDLRREGAARAPVVDPLLNTVVADRYRLLHKLGEGGMGTVYKAEHIRMGKALALKLLRGDFAQDPGAVARFRSEAQIVSRLSHPHTIAVFDFGELEAGDGFYLAMEYVPGKDLSFVLRAERRLGESRTVEIAQQMLGSLAEAHDAGIVHRDMKPGNVMLMQTRSGEDFAKVLDFGIAKLRDEGSVTTTTSVGAIVGTPNYLSPEQARGDLIDARSDLYSVGALLFELLAGRPPFHGLSPIAVVTAHLHEEPPHLLSLAPEVSEELAAIIHKALRKKPDDRWASADEMRGALLQLAAPRPTTGVATTPRPPTITTGDLFIARREDFEEFEREVTKLRRSRVVAPLLAALLLVGTALTLWRWPDVYGLLSVHAPAVVAALPARLRPVESFDGEEHEPNNSPTQANPLPLPPGPDGTPGGGVVQVRGHIGEKVSDTSGDIDVFRIEVPPGGPRRVLVADWTGERAGEGIRGLDVQLTLNRQRGAASDRTSAPLVASVDHAGPGGPERLVALVEAGTYYLAVREKHATETGPVEKPTDWYRLEVRLAVPEPGMEVEPNDAPDDPAARSLRYPEWRALAERNPLGEARPLRGELSASDADVLSVAPRGAAEAPQLLVVVPAAPLAVSVELWRPDPIDLAPPPNADRVRFEAAGQGEPGEVVAVGLGQVPRAEAPVLARLRAARGEGTWLVLALGEGSASGAAVLQLVGELAQAGRPSTALELAAAFARRLPGASGRNEVLLAAGRVAEAAAVALKPADLPALAGVTRHLGAPVLEVRRGALRYRAAFEALADGTGRPAEEAGLRAASLSAPCTPVEVAARAAAFARKYPGSDLRPEAERLEARALEAAFHAGSAKDRVALERTLVAWKVLARKGGQAGAEATARLKALAAKPPSAAGAAPICP